MNPIILTALALLAPESALPASPSQLTTIAEQSDWQRTGRYDEVDKLCHAFAARYAGVACERFGTTPEHRPMLALSVGKKGLPTLLFQGGIHAGEIDGKDAGFQFMRQYLDGEILDKALMAKVRLVFVPVFNVDGHERFGAHNRPNQIGPVESGWRTTAQNLNLNRDYVKAQAPEMTAMLTLLRQEDPIVYVDLHVTDGANFQHDVAVLVLPDQPDAPKGLAAAATALRARVQQSLTEAKHLPLTDFYPSFVREDDPTGGFAMGFTPPRFSDAYWATRNRLGILVETHSWKNYATRVAATRDTLVAVTRELAAHGVEWQKAARAADVEPLAGQKLTLDWTTDEHKSRPIDFLGYAYRRSLSPTSGKQQIHYDDKTPQVWRIPYFDTLVPKVTVELPRQGWVVAPAWAEIVRPLLVAHGITFLRLTARPLDVDVFHADDVQRPPMTFEGRATLTAHGSWRAEHKSLVDGGLFIPVAQPLGRLAANLLEPEGPDSLTSWGFFDGVFERKEYMEDYVLEDVATEMLRDPAVKAAFDKALTDPEFAKSPRKRLDFFYARHASFDAQIGLIPVYRLQQPLVTKRPHK